MELALGRIGGPLGIGGKSSFNPCFCGTCPRTSACETHTIASFRFNPCFCGTCPRTSYLYHQERNAVYFRFQSLFLWNLPSDSSLRLLLGLAGGFNPCFCGTCPRTGHPWEVANNPSIVSILVFVELALGHCRDSFATSSPQFQSLFLWNLPSDLSKFIFFVLWSRVSILVFVELALGLLSFPIGSHDDMVFQSLFLWNLPSDAGMVRTQNNRR